jgi:hypothetical protein
VSGERHVIHEWVDEDGAERSEVLIIVPKGRDLHPDAMAAAEVSVQARHGTQRAAGVRADIDQKWRAHKQQHPVAEVPDPRSAERAKRP